MLSRDRDGEGWDRGDQGGGPAPYLDLPAQYWSEPAFSGDGRGRDNVTQDGRRRTPATWTQQVGNLNSAAVFATQRGRTYGPGAAVGTGFESISAADPPHDGEYKANAASGWQEQPFSCASNAGGAWDYPATGGDDDTRRRPPSVVPPSWSDRRSVAYRTLCDDDGYPLFGGGDAPALSLDLQSLSLGGSFSGDDGGGTTGAMGAFGRPRANSDPSAYGQGSASASSLVSSDLRGGNTGRSLIGGPGSFNSIGSSQSSVSQAQQTWGAPPQQQQHYQSPTMGPGEWAAAGPLSRDGTVSSRPDDTGYYDHHMQHPQHQHPGSGVGMGGRIAGGGLWICLACGNENFMWRDFCNMRRCGAPRPSAEALAAALHISVEAATAALAQAVSAAPARDRPLYPSMTFTAQAASACRPCDDGRGVYPLHAALSHAEAQHAWEIQQQQRAAAQRTLSLLAAATGRGQLGPGPSLGIRGPGIAAPRPGYGGLGEREEPGDWRCAACTNLNYAFRQSCNMRRCGAPKPEYVAQNPPSLFPADLLR